VSALAKHWRLRAGSRKMRKMKGGDYGKEV